MEKVKKNPHSGQNSRGCTGTGQSCTGTGSVMFSILTSVRILDITFSFRIRFECFKFLIKIDFKMNQTSLNRYHLIPTLCGPKIHSKWGYVRANFWFSF